MVNYEPKEVPFHIISDGNAGTVYYTSSKKDTVYVPMIQIFSEQNVKPKPVKSVKMTIEKPRTNDITKTLVTASYGNIPGNVDYPYPNNRPNTENMVDVCLPIKGKIEFTGDVGIDAGKWNSFDKKIQALLTYMAKGLQYVYKNSTGIKFEKSNDNKTLTFSFDDSWGGKANAESFASCGVLSLSCDFILPLVVDGEQKEVPFHVISNGNAGTLYYESDNKDTVYVPMIQIFSEQNVKPQPLPLEYNFAIEDEDKIRMDKTITVAYNKHGDFDYKYPNNYTDQKTNLVSILFPLAVKLSFNQPCDVTLQSGSKEKLDFLDNRMRSHIYENSTPPVFQLASDKKSCTLTFAEDWKKQENAWYFSEPKAIQASLNALFSLRIKTEAGEDRTIDFSISSNANPTSKSVKNIPVIKIPFITIFAVNWRQVVTVGVQAQKGRASGDTKKSILIDLTSDTKTDLYVRGYYNYNTYNQSEIESKVVFNLRRNKPKLIDTNWHGDVNTGYHCKNDPNYDIFIDNVRNATGSFTLEYTNMDFTFFKE